MKQNAPFNLPRIILFLSISLLAFSTEIRAQTIDFNAEQFVDNADYGSPVYVAGNIRIISSSGNWYTYTSEGQSNSNALADLYFYPNSTVTVETLDGSEFDFQSFYYNGYASAYIDKLEGFRNGNSTGVKTSGFVDNTNTLTGTTFDNVDKVVFTSNAGFSSIFDTFVLGAAVTINNAPTVGGTSANQSVSDNASISPFSSVTVTDADEDNLTATITLDDNNKGTITGASSGSGPYTISGRSAAAMQTAIRSLVFNPTDNRTATTETTTFNININDGTDTTNNNSTSVVSSAVAPSVNSISISGSPASNTTTVNFAVIFNEAVSAVDANDFTIDGSGVTGNVTGISGSGSSYTVTVTSVSGTGTLSIDLKSSGTGIVDAGGKAINGGYMAGATHTVDTDPPSIPSAPNMAGGTDSGTSSSDDITTDTTPNFTGSKGDGSDIIKLTSSIDGLLGTALSNGSTNWLFNASPVLSEGIHNITATATDAAGNESASSTSLTITIDTSAPTLDSSSPADNATEVNGNGDITVTFNENIVFGTGNIEVIDETDASNSFTINAASPGAQASISNAVLTINPSGNLDEFSNYSVRIAASAIDDIAGNSFSGITNGTTFNFTTTGNTTPTVDTNKGLTVTEGATAVIDSGRLHASDAETSDDSQKKFTVTMATTKGSLFLDANQNNTLDAGDTALGVNATFTMENINNNQIRYTATTDIDISDSFIFSLSDPDGGTLTNQTFTITITPVNDAPTISLNTGITLNQGDYKTITNGALNEGDPDDSGIGLTYTITTDVINGQLYLDANTNGTFDGGEDQIDVTETFTQADLDNGLLTYQHNGSPTTSDSFTFSLADGGENGTSALINQTFGITINDVFAPTTTSVSVPANATYSAGQNLDFTVYYNENITVNTGGGTPQITITIGTTVHQVSYISGSGTSALKFRFTILGGELDTDGIKVGTLLANGGTIKDASFNEAHLTLNNVESTSAVLVDALEPMVTTMNPADDATAVARKSNFTIIFNENIIKGNGTIKLLDASDDRVIESIDVTTAAVGISGNVVTITPSVNLSGGKNYYIQIASTVFKDGANNYFAGISDNTSWSFAAAIKTEPTLSFKDIAKTYGDSSFSLNAVSNSTATITYNIISGGTGSAHLSGINNNMLTLKNTGTVLIKATLPEDANYLEKEKTVTLTIAPKVVTVTPDTKTKTYGDTDPTLTYTAYPSLEGQDIFTGSLTRVMGEEVGSYAIEQGTLSAGINYQLNLVSADLIITQKVITVTADNRTKIFGETDPTLTYSLTPSLIGSDKLTGNLSRETGEEVGNYAIEQGTLSAGANYQMNFVLADFIIDPKVIIDTKKPSLMPAEAITPNGDGINDYWVIPGIEDYPNALVRVYNRSGHELFAAKGYRNDWNATYKLNSKKLPSGSYMYIIDLANGSAPTQGWLFINY